MFQAHAVSKLVNCHPVQVDAVACSYGESLTIVKMRIAWQAWNIEENKIVNFTKIQFCIDKGSDAKKV